MSALRGAALVVVLTFIVGLCAAITARAADEADMDRGVKPGDDFYRYANGGWLKATTAQPGAPSDTRSLLAGRAKRRVRDLIQQAASVGSTKGSIAQRVGDYYISLLNTTDIEAKGLTPLLPELATISAITDKASLSAYLGTTLNSEVDGLTANADHIFGIWVNQGFVDSHHNLPHLWQGGLGMPDREAYLDPSPKMTALRAEYQAHIAAILKLLGTPDAEAKAARVLALEVQMAQSHAPDSDAADVFKQNNSWKRSDFAAKAPGLDWAAYFAAAGLSRQGDFTVWQPSAITGTSALIGSENLAVWKDYLTFHLVEHYAAVLPKAVRDEHFAFYGAILTGASQPPDRGDEAIASTNSALGQAVGQLYVQRYFPPQAKARAQAMGRDLIAAFRARIGNLRWMSPQTRQKALAKLAAFELDLGYPDAWANYASLDIVRGDAFGNMQRTEAFNRAHNLARLKEPVDPIDWPLDPQNPGAVIMFSPNAEFFSAALLEPPFFDPAGDAASNYGSAGAGMAHEISHSFDELGNIYDARGRLGAWWTAEDRARYEAGAASLAAQFDGYCPLASLCVSGKQVRTESIADLAGLLVAHDAYVLSLNGKADVTIGGLSGEQRFFLAFAQRWRKVQSEDALRRQIATDTHPPGEYRSDAVRNVEAWYAAFGVRPGDKLYLKPENRVGIW